MPEPTTETTRPAQPDFSEIRRRIIENQGKVFSTVTGIEFTYQVDANDYVILSRENYTFPMKDIQNVYERVDLPASGPGRVYPILAASPSYVWAILHDSRVRINNW